MFITNCRVYLNIFTLLFPDFSIPKYRLYTTFPPISLQLPFTLLFPSLYMLISPFMFLPFFFFFSFSLFLYFIFYYFLVLLHFISFIFIFYDFLVFYIFENKCLVYTSQKFRFTHLPTLLGYFRNMITIMKIIEDNIKC